MDILVVDDDPVALLMLRDTLTRAGYGVVAAANGREALAILRTRVCPVVISDWEMPELDGLGLCRAVRDMPGARYTYFILLTSRHGEINTVAGLSAGADDFVTKPFYPEELLLRVQTGQRMLSLQSRDLTIFALAKLAESRDTDTGAHLERVRNYARTLASYLREQPEFADTVNAGYIELIYLTSPLHDIGKVAIPDQILLKPGKLTPEEFEVMKTHTIIGAQTLESVLCEHPTASFLQMARDIALCHHEKFDGSGYPRGLVGRDIPLAARILAIADVFDALSCKRVYKPAFPYDVVRDMMLRNAGRHFDPVLIDAFVACEAEFIRIRNQHADAPAPEENVPALT